MKLKSKIIMGVVGTIALAIVPTTIALTSTSCGSSSSSSSSSSKETIANYSSNFFRFVNQPYNVYNPKVQSHAMLCKNYNNITEANNDLSNAKNIMCSVFKNAVVTKLGVKPELIQTNANQNNLAITLSYTLDANNGLCEKIYNKSFQSFVSDLKSCNDYKTLLNNQPINQIKVSLTAKPSTDTTIKDKSVSTYVFTDGSVLINDLVSPDLELNNIDYLHSKLAVIFDSTATQENGTWEEVPAAIVITKAISDKINEYMKTEVIGKMTKAQYNEGTSISSASKSEFFNNAAKGVTQILKDNGINNLVFDKMIVNPKGFDESVSKEFENCSTCIYAAEGSEPFVFEDDKQFEIHSSRYQNTYYFSPTDELQKTWLLKAIPTANIHFTAAESKQLSDIFNSVSKLITTKNSSEIVQIFNDNIKTKIQDIINKKSSSVQIAFNFGVWGGKNSFFADPKTGNILFSPNIQMQFADPTQEQTSDLILTVDKNDYAYANTYMGTYSIIMNNIATALPKQVIIENKTSVLNSIWNELKNAAAKIDSTKFDLNTLMNDPMTTRINKLLKQINPGLSVSSYNNWGGWAAAETVQGTKGSKLGIELNLPNGYDSVSLNDPNSQLEVGFYKGKYYLVPKTYFKTSITVN